MAVELDSVDKLSALQGSIDTCLAKPSSLDDVRHCHYAEAIASKL